MAENDGNSPEKLMVNSTLGFGAKTTIERIFRYVWDLIDSDLVFYRTTLLRTFQVVTICRVDKSEVLVVLISPHDSKRH
ncbi:hypothetical protein F511_26858 [Dorcoceras hygrometricum]|uniref:Uncharacterized protein n=1 Tax=Dorcoceras hygrometricum TaxID=472368 RepID=A0A2Z7C9Z2_9LAMI|nr:hypothetical protein F511_26858 [Dorcoceras hygrometricum]